MRILEKKRFKYKILKVKNATLEGKDYGFSLVIYPLLSRNKYMTTWDSGLIVYIHNSSFKPVSSDAVYIEPGKQSIITVKRTYTQKYPSPYSDCIDLTTHTPPIYTRI